MYKYIKFEDGTEGYIQCEDGGTIAIIATLAFLGLQGAIKIAGKILDKKSEKQRKQNIEKYQELKKKNEELYEKIKTCKFFKDLPSDLKNIEIKYLNPLSKEIKPLYTKYSNQYKIPNEVIYQTRISTDYGLDSSEDDFLNDNINKIQNAINKKQPKIDIAVPYYLCTINWDDQSETRQYYRGFGKYDGQDGYQLCDKVVDDIIKELKQKLPDNIHIELDGDAGEVMILLYCKLTYDISDIIEKFKK